MVKKESVDKTTKVSVVKKKNYVVIEEIKGVETSDSEIESDNEQILAKDLFESV